MRPLSLLILFFLMALMSCQRTEPVAKTYAVPADVEPYIQSFRDELKKRNNPLLIDNLIVTFGDSQQSEDVCGTCLLQSGQTPRITLNPDDFCWTKASINERECLVFHELGHCLLGRAHQPNRFPNRAYVSLMNPDDIAIYATCRYPIGDDICDKRSRRDYYIDELFESATPAPTWSK